MTTIAGKDDRFSRLERLIGTQGRQRLAASRITVAGLGAVGSYATEALVRAGIGQMRLVDFDVIRSSNMNRQLYALESTLGQPKSEVARKRILDIHPDCRVEAMNLFIHTETMDQVLEGPPDLVIDAIDSFKPKVELLSAAMDRGIPLISCMGAALRTDPLAIQIGPLGDVKHCPLARRIRKELRRRQKPVSFTCVHSSESVQHIPRAARGGTGEGGEEPQPRGRSRSPLGSLPTITGLFGLLAAHAALQLLLGGSWTAEGQKI
jgi:tRNA threonylcarbamoyladenosine dehydratase